MLTHCRSPDASSLVYYQVSQGIIIIFIIILSSSMSLSHPAVLQMHYSEVNRGQSQDSYCIFCNMCLCVCVYFSHTKVVAQTDEKYKQSRSTNTLQTTTQMAAAVRWRQKEQRDGTC